jgi:hypothetical protein
VQSMVFRERHQREVRSSLGLMGEDFSGSSTVTSRNSLLRNGATNATWSPHFDAEGVATCRRRVLTAALDGFHRYHRVLSRASWSSRKVSCVLLGLVVEAFVPEGPLVLGIDETLERRYGKKISAKGLYRDPVRSTHETFVKSSGLRWVCVMLLVEIPWAGRIWALPFLSALAPSRSVMPPGRAASTRR